MNELQELQARYDADLWDIKDPKFSVLRHILLHLYLTCGKITGIVEPGEHSIHRQSGSLDVKLKDKDIEILKVCAADLILHAAQLSNLINENLGDLYFKRCANNCERFAPESAFAQEMKKSYDMFARDECLPPTHD